MTGLIETKGVKDVPVWYNVYKKYPPEIEPVADRPPPPQDPIPEIIYEEDFERAKQSQRPQRKKPTSKTRYQQLVE